MSYYDSKELHDSGYCQGIRLDLFADDMISFSSSYKLPLEAKKEQIERGDRMAQEEYYLVMGRQLRFQHADKTVNYIESLEMDQSEEAPHDTSVFD